MSSRRGLFMDADTVLLPSFDPDRYMMKDKPSFYAKFAKGFAEPLLAFGASPHHDRRFTSRWVTETLRAIRREDRSWARRARRLLRTCLGKTAHVKWDYLGARILDPLAFDSQTRWAAEFIDAKSSGFLPGAGDEGYGPASVNAYWLGAGSDQLFSPAVYPHGIVALQNSWLPTAIKAMSRREVLSHPSRLGRLLNYVIG